MQPLLFTIYIAELKFKYNGRYCGTIMVDIDPLTLIKTTDLRCFGEVYQDKLVRFLKTFLYLGEFEGASPSSLS